MLRKVGLGLLVVVLLLAGYLALWPVPIEPVAWDAPTPPGYTGAHAVNHRLAGLNRLSLGGEVGPEHVAVGPDGQLYATVESGKILRLSPDGASMEVWAQTGGRVLGFDFDAQGRMIAADAMRGLLAIGPDRKIEVLVDRVNGEPLRYPDAVVVARSGKVYFTDASRRFGAREWGGTFEASVLDILEQSATGRVLEYDPATGQTRVRMDGLCFANGLALSADEQSLFVVETGRYRVWKLDLAQGAAQAKVLLSNLPGYPDNLMRGQDGRIWLGFTKPRNPVIDNMATKPFLRKLTVRLPRALWPVPKAYGHIIAFDESGRIVADLQDPSGAYPETSGVTETADRLYIQSLHAPTLGWLPKAAAEL